MWSIPSRHLPRLSRMGGRTTLASYRHVEFLVCSSRRPSMFPSRLQSTSSPAQSTNNSSSSRTLLASVLVASALSGLAGFFYAKRDSDAVDTLANPQFGSPEDYRQGIEELRSTLPSEDMVSTNPDDLLAHGMSANVWHPGKLH